jgi:hypothetical protein
VNTGELSFTAAACHSHLLEFEEKQLFDGDGMAFVGKSRVRAEIPFAT